MENEFTFCQKCGEKNAAENNFCQRCAAPLKENLQPPQPQPVLPPQQQYVPPNQQVPVPQYVVPNQQVPQPQFAPSYQQVQAPPKKKSKGLLIGILIGLGVILIITVVAFSIWFVNNRQREEELNNNTGETVYGGVTENGADSGNPRGHYTTILGDGKDTVTVMVYIIGSDLESGGVGCATADIDEMLKADLGSNVKLVLQTGGAKSWVNPAIKADTCQRFSVENKTLVEKENLGLVSMVEPDTVSGFISWAAANYPANRYAFIFWDHGGGTVLGYGLDEYFPDDMLELSEISAAMKNGGVKFDFVGFDACLMGTIETAYLMEPFADYLIASEETEPGTGWYYTNWLNALGSNPSMSTIDFSKMLIDDFISVSSYSSESCTLSVIELREIPDIYKKLCAYMANSTAELENLNYSQISTARAKAKEYGDGKYEQIDIIDYIGQAGVAGSEELQAAISSAVKYCKNTVSQSYGLAMYYPYKYPDFYQSVLTEMDKIGYGDDCTAFFDRFISIMVGGMAAAENAADSPLQVLTGEEDYSEDTDFSQYDWYDEEVEDAYGDVYSETDYGELPIVDKGEYYVLQLTDEEWDEITYIEMQVFLDDGEGYVDLGGDNVYDFDDDGDLKVDFDNTWVSLNGQVVPYYAEYEETISDDDWYTYGYVPAFLNNEKDIEIIIYWDNEYPDGIVIGYRDYTEDLTEAAAKGLRDFVEGDIIDFVCDYYTYDGNYDAQYFWGDTVTFGSGGLAVSYEDVGEFNTEVCFMLTDIYNNNYWTETVQYTY